MQRFRPFSRVLFVIFMGATWLVPMLAVGEEHFGPKELFRRKVAFSSDGSLVASSGKHVLIHDFKTGKLLREIEGERTEYIAFSPTDPNLFAVSDDQRTVRLWRLDQEECVRKFEDHIGYINSLVFDKSGKFLVSASAKGDPSDPHIGQLLVQDIETGELVHSRKVDDGKIKAFTFSDDGKLAAYCRYTKKKSCHVEVYELPEWKLVKSIRLTVDKKLEENRWGKAVPGGNVARFSADNKKILVAGGVCVRANPHGYAYACRPTMVLWSVDLDESTATPLLIDPERAHCDSIVLTQGGDRAICGNGPIEMRDSLSGENIWSESFARGLALSPDGASLVGCQRDGLIVLDAKSGEILRSIAVHQ